MLVILLFTYFVSYVVTQIEPEIKVKKIFTSKTSFVSIAKCPGFVDKSLLIKHIFEGYKNKLIMAPLGFGKSANLNMLRIFLAMRVDKTGKRDNKTCKEMDVFKNTSIYNQEKQFFDDNFGQHPVVHVDFNTDTNITNKEDALNIIKDKINDAYRQHKFLCRSTKLTTKELNNCKLWSKGFYFEKMSEKEVITALKKLTEYLYKHFDGKRVIVLVDKYDAIIRKAMFNVEEDVLQNICDLFNYIYNEIVTNNPCVSRTLITGIFHIAGSSKLNFKIYKFLDQHPLVQFYGFTDIDVNKLFTKFNFSNRMSEEAKDTYGGYNSIEGKHIYNTFSVLKCVQEFVTKYFWKKGGRVKGLDRVFRYTAFEESAKKLLLNECVDVEFDNEFTAKDVTKVKELLQNSSDLLINPNYLNAFFSFLYDQGYFSFANRRKSCIRLANIQIEEEFATGLKDHYVTKYRFDGNQIVQTAMFFYNILFHIQSNEFPSELNKFQVRLQQHLKQFINTSVEKVTREADLQHLMFCITFHAFGYTRKNQINIPVDNSADLHPSPRLDMLMHKGPYAVLMQYKWHDNNRPDSKQPLQYILDRQYYNVLQNKAYIRQEIKYYYLFGISINNIGDVSVSCLQNTTNITHALTVPLPSPSHF